MNILKDLKMKMVVSNYGGYDMPGSMEFWRRHEQISDG